MLSRFFVHFMILTLFVVGQVGVATHALEHFQPQIAASADSDHEKDEHSAALCLQCVAKSQAEHSDLPSAVGLSISNTQADILSIPLSNLALLFAEPYCARAPPKYA